MGVRHRWSGDPLLVAQSLFPSNAPRRRPSAARNKRTLPEDSKNGASRPAADLPDQPGMGGDREQPTV